MARKSQKTIAELAALPKLSHKQRAEKKAAAELAKRKRMPEPEPVPAPLEGDTLNILSPAQKHRARMAMRARKPKTATREHVAELMQRMREQEMPIDICSDEHMPTYAAMRKLIDADEELSNEYAAAFASLANGMLEDAATFARDVTETSDIDAARMADLYVKSLNAALEKLAPKTHGTLVKHAGADGGAITVLTVDYARTKAIAE